MDITLVLAGLAAAAAGFLVATWQVFQQRRSQKTQAPTLEDRISNLTKNLESALSVVAELEREIFQRKELAQRLQQDVERYNQLRQLNQAQVEAIAQTLRVQVAKESRKFTVFNGVITFVVGLVFFIVGFFLGGT